MLALCNSNSRFTSSATPFAARHAASMTPPCVTTRTCAPGHARAIEFNAVTVRGNGTALGGQNGSPSTNFWLDDVSCVGTEASLFDCSHAALGVHNCNATTEAVRLTCN